MYKSNNLTILGFSKRDGENPTNFYLQLSAVFAQQAVKDDSFKFFMKALLEQGNTETSILVDEIYPTTPIDC